MKADSKSGGEKYIDNQLLCNTAAILGNHKGTRAVGSDAADRDRPGRYSDTTMNKLGLSTGTLAVESKDVFRETSFDVDS